MADPGTVVITLTVSLRPGWFGEVREAMGDGGSNDAEHDLLREVYDDLRQARIESLNAYELRQEAERVISEDRVPLDELLDIVRRHGT